MKSNILSTIFSGLAGLIFGILVVVAIHPAEAARENDVWVERLGSYVESVFDEGRDVLINGVDKYLNFGVTSGSAGYGFRDNSGDIQYKDDGGSWTSLNTLGGGGTSVALLLDGVSQSTAISSLDFDTNYYSITEPTANNFDVTFDDSNLSATIAWADTDRLGFVNRAESTISFNDSTYVFTLADVGAGWSYYRNGVKYTISGNKTTTLAGAPPTAGHYFVYIDANDGTLTNSTTEWTLLDDKLPVASVFWDNSATPKYWIADERHSFSMDKSLHYYIHATQGTSIVSMPTLSGYTIDTDTDTAKTFGISASSLLDQDYLHNLASLTDPNGTATDYVLWYRTGASTWTWKYGAMPFDYTAAGYINYDNAGTQTQGQNNKWYNSYLLATNAEGDARYVIVSGRSEFTSLASAQAEDIGSFDWTGLEIEEGVIVYRLTWKSNSSYTGKGKVELDVAPVQLNIGAVTNTSSGAGTDHNTLANLQGGTTNEYYHLNSSNYTELTSWLDDMVLESDGDTGFGTTTAEAKVDIWGDTGSKILTLFSNTGTKFMEMLNTGATTLLGVWDFGGATSIEIVNNSNPTVDASGEIAINTGTSSIRFYDGTAERQIKDEFSFFKVSLASSSLAYDGSYGASGTTTYRFPVGKYPVTLTDVACQTDGSGDTNFFQIGNGSATTSIQCTYSGAHTSSSVSLSSYGYFFVRVGTQSGNPNRISTNVLGRYTAD